MWFGDQSWRGTRASFLVPGVLLSIVMLAGAAVSLPRAFKGRVILRDPSGAEVTLGSMGNRMYVPEAAVAGMSAAERASVGTIAHDPSIQWQYLLSPLVAIAMLGPLCVGSARELARRRRSAGGRTIVP